MAGNSAHLLDFAQSSGCIGARVKTSSETIMERSRPISLLHGTSSNLYKDRSVTMSGGLENNRSSHQYVQSSAWDQNSKLLHDNSNSPNFVNHGDEKQTFICFKKDITCKIIM